MFIRFLMARLSPGPRGAAPAEEKGKRKRIIKASTGISTEEAVVEDSGEDKKSIKKPVVIMPVKKEEKAAPVKKSS
ncbi:MAG: hypothetical protein WDO71_07435 [Bacteroidota bacterium]